MHDGALSLKLWTTGLINGDHLTGHVMTSHHRLRWTPLRTHSRTPYQNGSRQRFGSRSSRKKSAGCRPSLKTSEMIGMLGDGWQSDRQKPGPVSSSASSAGGSASSTWCRTISASASAALISTTIRSDLGPMIAATTFSRR